MRQTFAAIAALLLASSLLLMGNGLQNTLLALRANLEGFPLSLIGALTSAYFVGFIAGCRVTPVLVKRVGHIRVFAALASLASAAALGHALWVNDAFWIALRVLTGFSIAGVQMIIESWLNERATNRTRGGILGAYRMIDLVATTVGQMLLTLAAPSGFALFAVASILVSIALVPVSLTTAAAPQPITTAHLDLPKLLRVAPLAAVNSLAVGMGNGVFWAMAAVYVRRLGFEVPAVATFMSVVIVSGALAQWPIGAASDRADRRRVLVGGALLASLSALAVMAVGARSFEALLATGALFGVCAMPLYGLGAAHANDHTAPGDFVEVSGGLFLAYGIGSVIGPLAAPWVMQALGPGSMFGVIGAIYLLLATYGAVSIRRHPLDVVEFHEAYVPVPRTTPVVFEIDPRSEHEADVDENQLELELG
jgi:MFS family permease